MSNKTKISISTHLVSITQVVRILEYIVILFLEPIGFTHILIKAKKKEQE